MLGSSGGRGGVLFVFDSLVSELSYRSSSSLGETNVSRFIDFIPLDI